MILILFVGIHVAYRPRVYKAGLLHLVPLSRRNRAEAVLDETSRALKLWLAARFTSMAVVGVLTVIGLAIADIPLALSLWLIAALLSFIPYLGPILSVIPAILVALAGDPGKVIWVLVVYGVVQFVESYLATPLIEQEATSVPAALLIVVQVLLAVMAGALGIFLASPLAVAATVLLQMLYVQDVLKDRIKTLAER
jgi:predicted PurR-regulated permease PerM